MNYFHASIHKYKMRNKTYLEPKKKKKKNRTHWSYRGKPYQGTCSSGKHSEVSQRWGIVSHAASSSPARSVLIAKLGDREEVSLSKRELSLRPAAAELFPPFPGKTPECLQRL